MYEYEIRAVNTIEAETAQDAVQQFRECLQDGTAADWSLQVELPDGYEIVVDVDGTELARGAVTAPPGPGTASIDLADVCHAEPIDTANQTGWNVVLYDTDGHPYVLSNTPHTREWAQQRAVELARVVLSWRKV